MPGRERRLTYADYINDRALIEALRIPQPPPKGQSVKTWPLWHRADDPPMAEHSVEWTPGQRWPGRATNWSHHEVLFIRVHQAFEIWFAVVLHELSTVLTEAQSQSEIEGRSMQRVVLSERTRLGREFSPHRFPQLAAVAKDLRNEFIKERVYVLPTPGRHAMTGASLDFPAEALRRWSDTVHRAAEAIRVSIPFFDVLATLTPAQFMEFRGRLAPASGFGSTQFRELEMLLGLRELSAQRLAPTNGASEPDPGEPPIPTGMLRPTLRTPVSERQLAYWLHHIPGDWARLASRYQEPSLRDLVYGVLNANIFNWSDTAAVDAAIDEFAALNVRTAVQPFDSAASIDEGQVSELIDGLGEVLSHRETTVAALLSTRAKGDKQTALHAFLERCLQMDAALLRWRDHHIRFVEGMIGRRPGTGGAGVNYLRSTTDPGLASFLTHALPCLWQARTLVQPV
jgi:tryptophan 2,3-dioxygenase